MGVHIQGVKIKNFRSHKNTYVSLEPLTLLVGSNNAGKTSFLKAIAIALQSDKRFISREDLYINKDGISDASNRIDIDLKIVPDNHEPEFDDKWIAEFGADAGTIDNKGIKYLAFKTIIKFDTLNQEASIKRYRITDWEAGTCDESDNGLLKAYINKMPLYFIDAQRDLVEDIKSSTSYFGRLAKQIKYDPEILKTIEAALKKINEDAVEESVVLKHIKKNLEELNNTVKTNGKGVEISPLPKRIRDLHKGLKVHFQDGASDTFSIEYHGMGTRSWASLLAYKAFIKWENELNIKENEAFSPILALEEPEAHLHPHAQKQLYSQLKTISGQKIISTHSPYTLSSAKLNEIRLFIKDEDFTRVQGIDLGYGKLIKKEEDRKIKNVASRKLVNESDNLIQILKDEEREQLRRIKNEIFSSKGEILFSKCVVLFEGITEEQSLPLFGEEYYGINPFELGITFINVQGKHNYYPYINLLKSCNINWVIFSDSEADTIIEVKKQVKDAYDVEMNDQIIFLPEGSDYEDYIINNYENIVRSSISKYESGNSNQRRNIIENNIEWSTKKTKVEVSAYLKNHKAKISPFYTEEIINKSIFNKRIPEKIITLFDKVNEYIDIESKYKKFDLLFKIVDSLPKNKMK